MMPSEYQQNRERSLTAQLCCTACCPLTGSCCFNYCLSKESASNDSDEGTKVLTLSGTGTVSSSKPDIAVVDLAEASLSTLDFGNTAVDDTSSQSFLITNTGAASLTVTSAVISGNDADNFELVIVNLANKSSDDYVIAADGQRAIQLRYSPTATGSHSAVLTLTSNDPDETTTTINLTGTATEANIVVDLTPTDSTVSNALNPTIDFGQSVNDGTGNQTGTFPINIVNTGTANLTISSITLAQQDTPFSISGIATDGVVVTPGQTISATVTFDPAANGIFTDTLTFNSDDADSPTMQFNLSGLGVQAATSTVTSATPLTYTDSDGDTVEVKVVGRGTAQIVFDGAGTNGNDIDNIAITEATAGTRLLVTVTTLGGDGNADIDTITVDAAFGIIDVEGSVDNIDVDGKLKTVELEGTLGDLDVDGSVTTINVGGLSGTILADAIRTLVVTGNMTDTDITTDPQFKGSSVNKMTVNGNITNSTISTGAIRGLEVNGNIDGLDITTTGDRGQVSKVKLTGNVNDLDITTTNVSKFEIVGNITDSSITATTGKGQIGQINVTGDADLDVDLLGNLGKVQINGDLSGEINADGSKGQIANLNVTGDLTADLSAFKAIRKIDVGGNIDATSINVDGDGRGQISQIKTGGSMEVDSLTIDGHLRSLTVGSADTTADLSGNIDVTGMLTKARIFGDVLADVSAGTRLGTIEADGDLDANASLTSVSGDIDKLLFGDAIFGSVTANNGAGRVKFVKRSANTFQDADTGLNDSAGDHINADLSRTKWQLV